MARNQSIVYDPSRDGKLSAKQLYIFYNGRYIKLSDIRYFNEKELNKPGVDASKLKMESISSLEEFRELKDNKTNFYLPPTYSIAERIQFGDVEFFPEKIVNTIIRNLSTKTMPINPNDVEFWEKIDGLQRVLSFKHQTWKKGDGFVLVKLHGESEFIMIKKSEIEVYLDETSTKATKLSNISDSTQVENAIVNIIGGKAVDEIYLGSQFNFDQLLSYNELDLTSASEVTLELENGKYVKKSATSIPRYFSEQIPVEVKEPNPARARLDKDGEAQETHIVHKIKCLNYELNEDGNYIMVKPKQFSTEIMVDMDELFLDDKCEHSAANLSVGRLYGARLFAKRKDEESIIEIESLSMRQAMLRYAPIYSYQLTENSSDVLGPNSYLTIEDGTPVLETELIKPLAYDVVDQVSASFDAYYCKGSDGNSYVLSKEFFKSGESVGKHRVNGGVIEFRKENCCKIARVQDYQNAQIVQTNSIYGSEVNNCSVVGGEIEEKTFVSSAKIQDEIQTEYELAYGQFVSEHRSGKYYMETVYLDGELCGLNPTLKRYVLTNEVYAPDYAHENCKLMHLSDIQFSEKNGNYEVYGGPQFSWKKSMKKYFDSTFKMAGSAGIAIAGAIGPFAIPFAIGLYAYGIAATPLAMLVNGVRKVAKDGFIHRTHDKAIDNKERWAKDIDRDLHKIYENLSDPSRTFSEEAVQAMFLGVKAVVATQGISRFQSSFKFNNGVALVDEDNLAMAEQYKKSIAPKLKKINALQQEIDKATAKGKDSSKLISQLNELKSEVDQMNAITRNGLIYPETSQCAVLDSKARNMQAYFLITRCDVKNAELSAIADFDLTKLAYSLEKDQFSYDGKVLDLKTGTKQEKEILTIIDEVKIASLSNHAVAKEEVVTEKDQEIQVDESAEFEEAETFTRPLENSEESIWQDGSTTAVESDEEYLPTQEELETRSKIAEKESRLSDLDELISGRNAYDVDISNQINQSDIKIEKFKSMLSDIKTYRGSIEEHKKKTLDVAYNKEQDVEKQLEWIKAQQKKCLTSPKYAKEFAETQGIEPSELQSALEREVIEKGNALEIAKTESLDAITKHKVYCDNLLVELRDSKGIPEDIAFAPDADKIVLDLIHKEQQHIAKLQQKQNENIDEKENIEKSKSEIEAEIEELEKQIEELSNDGQGSKQSQKDKKVILPSVWSGKLTKDNLSTLLRVSKQYLTIKNISNSEEVKEFIQNNISLFEIAVNKREKYKYLIGQIEMIADINNNLVKIGFTAKLISYEMSERVTMEENQV